MNSPLIEPGGERVEQCPLCISLASPYDMRMNVARETWVLTILSALLLSGVGLSYMKREAIEAIPVERSDTTPKDTILIGGETFWVEVMKTRESQTKGLSGRASLGEHEGMLFWFTRDDSYPFWMPNMHFSIDILWIDKNWTIAHIEESVPPESYPATFASPIPARYVLEVPAGTLKQIGVKIGQKITFGSRTP